METLDKTVLDPSLIQVLLKTPPEIEITPLQITKTLLALLLERFKNRWVHRHTKGHEIFSLNIF